MSEKIKITKPDRFVKIVHERSTNSEAMIVYVDTETAVQYLVVGANGEIGGVTVMVDEDGKPLLNEEYKSK